MLDVDAASREPAGPHTVAGKYRRPILYPVEIIARWLCREDGCDPDLHWEQYAGEAGKIIRELAECGWSIGPTAVAS